jgi:predicted nuclease of predicted toxin-antitoxin system
MKIMLDVNLTPRWVQFLGAAGFEVCHWSQVGRANAPDEEIMAYAARFDFVVLTHNLNFSAILAATKGGKPSVVQIRVQNIASEAVGLNIIAARRGTRAELETGALLAIGADRTRMRLLPLQSDSQSNKNVQILIRPPLLSELCVPCELCVKASSLALT